MTEVIQAIIPDAGWIEDWQHFEGYRIQTDKQQILIGISSGQSCCEETGYFSTNDSPQDFVGATLTGIKLTDISLNTEMINKRFEYGFDGGGIQFVDLETDRGTFQIAVYNAHNGYYGHDIRVTSEQLKYEDVL